MTPEEKARLIIDEKLCQSGWIIQDMNCLNLAVSLGVAVREFPTSTGEVDYALFIDGQPVGVVEAKREEAGQSITDVEIQSGRYAKSTFKWVKEEYTIRFAYEATDKLIRFTDYKDIKYRSRTVFSFHRPETLQDLLKQPDTIRNNMKHFPVLDGTWVLDWTLGGTDTAKVYEMNESLGDTGATVKEIEISPVSCHITYEFPRTEMHHIDC